MTATVSFGPVDTRFWHSVEIKTRIDQVKARARTSQSCEMRFWLRGDHAKGEYREFFGGGRGTRIFVFSDPNTAIGFRLRFG